MVDAYRAPEGADLADIIEDLNYPDALTLGRLRYEAYKDGHDEARELLSSVAKRKAIPHRLKEIGYVLIRNPDAKDGYWKIGRKRQPVYVKIELSPAERYAAAEKLAEDSWRPPPDGRAGRHAGRHYFINVID